MDELSTDLRVAVRTLARSPGFTAVVLLLLALGIGANAALFTLTDQVLFRPLPVADPQELVVLDAPGPFSGSTHSHTSAYTELSHPMYAGLRDAAVFHGMLAHYTTSLHVTIDGTADEVNGDLVSGTYFTVLGLEPAVGRLLRPDDDRVPGGHPVVVLGHSFWSRRFAADPGVVGRSLLVNGHAMTVIGVGPAGFTGAELGQSTDVFVPLAMQPQVLPTWSRGIESWRARFLTVMARLRDGQSAEEAAVEANVVYAGLLREDLAQIEGPSERFRTAFLEKRLALLPGHRGTSTLREAAGTPLVVLMAMVGLVLLIACANVANLLLARASSRQREIALRITLGASRARLVRQLLAESLLVALAGGALGLLVATWAARALIAVMPSEQAPLLLSAEMDLRMTLFALLLAVATGVVFGLAPALQSTRPRLAATLKEEAASARGGSASFLFRKGLVVAQIALSALLLVGAGLFARSLMNLRALDPGFDPAGLVTFSVDPALSGYEPSRRVDVLGRLLDGIAAEPGVREVSLAAEPLLADGESRSTVRVEGYESKEGEDMAPNVNVVAPGFFSTVGIPLVAGRDLDVSDRVGGPQVAVVNEVFARYFFGDQDPVGRRFAFGRDAGPLDLTIVGVVRDGRTVTLRDEPKRFVYLPYAQQDDLGSVTFYVRSPIGPEVISPRLREIVRGVDPLLPIESMKTMQAQIGESLFVERLTAWLSMGFGLLATLLATVGLYGVTSYAVAQRTREIGIRMALGAGREAIHRMVLSEVAVLAALGVVIGLPSGWAVGRLVESQLYGLTPLDPPTFAAAGTLLIGVCLLAGWLPAARATRVDPMVALRYE